jgi:hypothetical protein
MKHLVIRWNPATQEWFCIKCGRTSDHISEEDARVELDQHDCQLPSQGTSPPPGTETVRLIRKPYKMTPKAENAVRDSVGKGATEEDSKKKWRELAGQAANEKDPENEWN